MGIPSSEAKVTPFFSKILGNELLTETRHAAELLCVISAKANTLAVIFAFHNHLDGGEVAMPTFIAKLKQIEAELDFATNRFAGPQFAERPEGEESFAGDVENALRALLSAVQKNG